jgi:hypothetical protein
MCSSLQVSSEEAVRRAAERFAAHVYKRHHLSGYYLLLGREPESQDFYNLTKLYLDAVFFPRLTRETFEQEGWHYEMESVASQPIYKGVVFNEMKGPYSSPEGGDFQHDREAGILLDLCRIDRIPPSV